MEKNKFHSGESLDEIIDFFFFEPKMSPEKERLKEIIFLTMEPILKTIFKDCSIGLFLENSFFHYLPSSL